MWPPVFDLGVVRVTILGLALTAGFVLGSFMWWRRLREDYDQEDLLTVWLWLVVATWVGSGVWVWWSSGYRQIWSAVGLGVLVLWWWARRLRWNFWELLDVWGPLSLAGAVLAALGWGPVGWPAALAAVGGVILTSLVRSYYRRWRWYKSGRVGLVGLVSLAWWGVVNLPVANFSWWAVYSLSWMTVVAGVAVYLRSGRQISHDLGLVWPKKRKQ